MNRQDIPKDLWIEFGQECDPFVMRTRPSFPSDAVRFIEYEAYRDLICKYSDHVDKYARLADENYDLKLKICEAIKALGHANRYIDYAMEFDDTSKNTSGIEIVKDTYEFLKNRKS